jgi:hypothetical protein
MQRFDGGWTGDVEHWRQINSAYALLFLARGRAPVALQKLQFDGRWNNRSRDAAQLARWISRQTERHNNWQIVNARSTPAELRESPILYLASDKPIDLPAPLLERLRQFVDQGGVILAVAEGPAPAAVAQSIESLGRRLFPRYAFTDLAPQHLLYTANFPTQEKPPAARTMSNGIRELIILLPDGDLSWQWQRGAGDGVAARTPHFGFVGNLHLYMTDRANPRFKGDDHWVSPDPGVTPKQTITVARLTFDGNDDPEPGAWQRFSAVVRNESSVGVETVATSPAKLDQRLKLAHLTCPGPFELTEADRAGLRRYLDAGGLLLFDAAGGAAVALDAMTEQLRLIYPDATVSSLPLDHPIYLAGDGRKALRQVSYRKFAAARVDRDDLPRLKCLIVNGRVVALLSGEDLISGLVGHGVDGIVGYSPQSATDLVRNVILWRLNRS